MILKYIRLSICALLIAISASIWIIITLFRPTNPANTFGIARIVGAIGRFVLGIKIKLEDEHQFSKRTNSVIISNHQSNYDMFYVGQICPKNTVSVGKKALIYFPFFGIMYWLSGNILIDRANRSRAWKTMDKVVATIKKYNCNIWIMPEGTRSKNRELLPFKKGAFVTAIKGGHDIVPICFSHFDKSIDLTKFRAGTIYAKTLKPIPTKDYTLKTMSELIELAQNQMAQEIKKLNELAG